MKNLSGNKKGNFEKAWQDAFEGREITPSQDVWMKVDGHLANQESKKYRKGIFFYKWTAAASLLLAIGITLFYLYDFNLQGVDKFTDNQDNQVEFATDQDKNNGNEKANTILPTNEIASNDQIEESQGINASTSEEANVATNIGNNEAAQDQNGNAIKNIDNNNSTESDELIAQNKSATNNPTDNLQDQDQRNDDQKLSAENVQSEKNIDKALATNTVKGLENQQNQVSGVFPGESDNSSVNNTVASNIVSDSKNMENTFSAGQQVAVLPGLGAELLTQVESEKPDYLQKVMIFKDNPFKEEGDKDYDDLWAGVDFSSGRFNPNFGSGRSKLDAQALNNEFTASLDGPLENFQNRSIIQGNSGGQSFSFGFNMGKRISKKWILQGGVNYLNYSSQGETNTFYELENQNRTPAVADYNVTNALSLNFASSVIDYENQFQFLSIPVKAGFIVFDKKFGMVVSAGVGTDFWLKNRISPNGNGLEDLTITPGDDAPYRRLYFNGLVSTQFKYQFSKQYSITIEPTYSVAINSFSKSDTNLDSFPNVFNLGIGLKYHFK